MYVASPQQGDLRLSRPQSGQGTGGGARTRDRKVPANLRANSLGTAPVPRDSPLRELSFTPHKEAANVIVTCRHVVTTTGSQAAIPRAVRARTVGWTPGRLEAAVLHLVT
ncbi:hypothetical protein PoB_001095300 [Plakobranchus ocellatus]|uniref:Uncharacterized protein n=1 Tax=Plakobranchus ocellatus TaxID=259542 RepID=A0AAV3YQ40_9GAST|nr:hypothetical protein PoB_001095300 [Plakobranchus ocellatus]